MNYRTLEKHRKRQLVRVIEFLVVPVTVRRWLLLRIRLQFSIHLIMVKAFSLFMKNYIQDKIVQDKIKNQYIKIKFFDEIFFVSTNAFDNKHTIYFTVLALWLKKICIVEFTQSLRDVIPHQRLVRSSRSRRLADSVTMNENRIRSGCVGRGNRRGTLEIFVFFLVSSILVAGLAKRVNEEKGMGRKVTKGSRRNVGSWTKQAVDTNYWIKTSYTTGIN